MSTTATTAAENSSGTSVAADGGGASSLGSSSSRGLLDASVRCATGDDSPVSSQGSGAVSSWLPLTAAVRSEIAKVIARTAASLTSAHVAPDNSRVRVSPSSVRACVRSESDQARPFRRSIVASKSTPYTSRSVRPIARSTCASIAARVGHSAGAVQRRLAARHGATCKQTRVAPARHHARRCWLTPAR